MSSATLTDNTQFKNKWSWIIIICMLLLMLIVFLVFGEINLSHLNWLVATNGKKWGLLKDGTTGFGVNNGPVMIGWEIFVIMGGILLMAIIAMVVLMLTNRLHFSSFAFIIASWVVFFTIITSGLLYPSASDSFKWQILVRVLLVFVAYPLAFFPFNWIFKKCFINTKYGEAYIDNLISAEKANAQAMKEINEQQKARQTHEVKTVEIESKDI